MTERAVAIGAGLGGTLAAPRGEGLHPCVVLLHGFGGHRDETGNLFSRLARSLAKGGIASLRIDFPGCGKSEGEFADVTASRYRRAAIAAMRYAKSAPGMKPDRLGLLGYSFGGAIAAACLGGDAPRARALVLWAPVGEPAVDMVESLGAARAAEAERVGIVAVPWGKGEIRLKRAFFHSLAELKPLAAVARYDGAFFVVAGSGDRLVKHVGPLYEAAVKARRREQRVIDGADHFFGVGNRRDERRGGHVEPLLAETTAFLVSALGAK
ncbi:MAG TPA: alpha/beta fold hydrolase [Alphaproteobacteria bacterium]